MKNAPSPGSGLCGQDLAVPCGVRAVPQSPEVPVLGWHTQRWSRAASVSGIRAAAVSQKSVPVRAQILLKAPFLLSPAEEHCHVPPLLH